MVRRIALCMALVSVATAWTSWSAAQQVLPLTEVDLQFMARAAEGGAAEVEMGRLAATRAANDAVRRFGQRLMTDHAAAGAQLQALALRKGVVLSNALDPRHRATYDRLATLSGADFDRTYVVEMINDHDADVPQFERASQAAQDPDLRAWAAATLPVLREHQAMARQLGSLLAAAPAVVAPATLPAAVVVVPPAPEPLWCGGRWRATGGSNFSVCPR